MNNYVDISYLLYTRCFQCFRFLSAREMVTLKWPRPSCLLLVLLPPLLLLVCIPAHPSHPAVIPPRRQPSAWTFSHTISDSSTYNNIMLCHSTL